MCLAEGVVVVGVDVGRIVIARVDRFVQAVGSCAGGVAEQFAVRILAIVEGVGAAGVARLVEPVGEVCGQADALVGGDDQARGVGEVGGAVHVAVRAFAQQDVPSVAHLVVQVRRAVQPRAVWVLHREAGQGVAGAVSEGVLHAAVALEGITRAVERSVVAQRGPLVDAEVYLRAEVVLAVDVGVLAEDAFLVVIGAGDEVLHVFRASAERDAVLLRGTLVVVQHVPPVVVAVVDPLLAPVARVFHHPGAVGVLGLVVDAGQELLHVIVGVVDVQAAVVGFPELVDGVDRPVAGVFVVGRGGGRLPAHASAVSHGGFAFGGGSALGGDEDDSEGGACTVDGRCRGVFNDGDGFYVVGVDEFQVADGAVDEHQGAGAVDGGDAAHVDGGRAAGHAGRGGDVQSRHGTLQHVGQRV